MESKLTSKGQITIPKEARELLGLRPGDRVKFVLQPGQLVMLPKAQTTDAAAAIDAGKRVIRRYRNALRRLAD